MVYKLNNIKMMQKRIQDWTNKMNYKYDGQNKKGGKGRNCRIL